MDQLLFWALFLSVMSSFVCQGCDPSEMIKRHEGMKQCMYLDSRKIPTIGVGFNLQATGARQAIESVGASYDRIVNGQATPVRTACDCSRVVCLNQTQVNGLFKISLKRAMQDATGVIPTLPRLCCGVQNALVDMTFNLGKSKLAVFTDFLKFLRMENWQVTADDLLLTKYCNDRDTSSRCRELAAYIQKGCPCFGSYPKQCSSQSACCGANTKCCQYTHHFSGYITKDLTEIGCCPFSDGVCCPPAPFCCPSNYPVCCKDNKSCCPAAYPVCAGDLCYRENGTEWVPNKAKAAAKSFKSEANHD
ncbi:uncharacterized protein LOC106154686 [Lingula anatina]|uniref:Uncharacterized protein LOC106154686 n=1 Tax=Lingula anatina TaxID=7574 RepID=A0A1S3HEY6_LINAN|nr:uncharacterized protein LOC106154686 [Lingula anatina]|eukprot:XP_013384585.1 uncharacterized protein LOC106154686 [Lingula anatina]